MANKMFDLNNPRCVEEVLRLLDDEGDDEMTVENFEDESDTDGEDHVEPRESDSESEQGDEIDEEVQENENSNFSLGKDKTTKWYHVPSSKRVRAQAHNITKKLAGVKGPAENAKTPIECWNCLFTPDILQTILTYTNQYIEIKKDKYKRSRDAMPLDLIELKAFIGLLFLAGVYKGNRQSLEDLWGIDGDGVEKFGLVMNLKRFKFIIRCLRFDDQETRAQRKEQDRLAAVRQIFTKFVENCQINYSLGDNVTIDDRFSCYKCKQALCLEHATFCCNLCLTNEGLGVSDEESQ